MDVDIEVESDEDNDKQIKDVEQLNAVLEADDPPSSVVSRYSATSVSLPCPSSKLEEYSKIETAIALNKLSDDKLIRLEKILVDRLRECRAKLAEIQNCEQTNDKIDKVQIFRYVNCGKPYFKDKNGFTPPDNVDTMLMAKMDMFDFSNITSISGWTVKDKSEFLTILHKMSKDIKIKDINSQIAQLKRDAVCKKNVNIDLELAGLKEEIKRVGKKGLKEIALPVGQDYDWDIVANAFNYRHTAQEYSSIWRLFLHPSVNKDAWTKAEHQNLEEIAQSFNLQDWEEIASQLNTGRTEYQCFVYFRTNMGNSFTNQKWTKEEEEYLKRLIEYYREDNYIPWGRVAASIENRTKIQVYNKYHRLLEIRKGRFLPEEDAVILHCVEEYGQNFDKIKNFVAGRSAAQLRNRYYILTKHRLSTIWTKAEDKKLLEMMANQDSSTNFASVSKHLPGKDRVHIRARYITLIKWMQRNPNVDIALAPRRGARRLCHGKATVDLNKAVEKLKNRMQSEVENKKSKRVTKASSEEEIDESIVAVLITELIKDAEKKTAKADDVVLDDQVHTTNNANASNLRKILILLRASLNRHAFTESSYYNLFPELMTPQKEVGYASMKSYSKKNTINTVQVNTPPDIWGTKISNSASYVMPPNFATITGCRSLIAHTSKASTRVDFAKKKNATFKEQMRILMERFNILFVWPMLLSNELPRDSNLVTNQDDSKSVKPFTNASSTQMLRNTLLCEDSEDDT